MRDPAWEHRSHHPSHIPHSRLPRAPLGFRSRRERYGARQRCVRRSGLCNERFRGRLYRGRSLIETLFRVKRKLSTRALGHSLLTQKRQALLLGLSFDLYCLRHRYLFPRMPVERSFLICAFATHFRVAQSYPSPEINPLFNFPLVLSRRVACSCKLSLSRGLVISLCMRLLLRCALAATAIA